MPYASLRVLPQTAGYGGAKRKTPHELDPLANRQDVERVDYEAAVHDAVQPYHAFFGEVPSGTPAGGHNVVKARRLCRLFYPKLANFLMRHPRRALTMYEASLWGFTEEEARAAARLPEGLSSSQGQTMESVV